MNDYSKLNKVSLEIRNQVEKREHFKKYLMDDAEYFAASAAVLSGNGYAAAQIMRNARDIANADK